MTDRPLMTAAEVEKLSPDDRAQLLNESLLDDLSELSPEFRARVQAKGRRLLAEHGLLDLDQS